MAFYPPSGGITDTSDFALLDAVNTFSQPQTMPQVHSTGTLALTSDTSTVDAGLCNIISVNQIQGAGQFPATIDLSQITISDFSNRLSVDWGNRLLADTSGATVVDWSSGQANVQGLGIYDSVNDNFLDITVDHAVVQWSGSLSLVGGTITADGSLLTNLTAANLTGTINNARLSGVAFTASANTFIGGQVVANTGGASIVPLKILANSGQSGNLFQIRNSADSATIMQIDASGNMTLNNASITCTNGCTAGGFSQKSTAQVTWTQSTNPFDTLDTGLARSSAGVVKVTNGGAGSGSLTAATITATTGFSGVGSSLTSLTAANLTGSHTLPDGTLSTNVPLLNAANTFTANQSITGSLAATKRITSGVVVVTPSSNTYTIDASSGDEFTATLAATNTFAVPSNAVDGHKILVRVKQDGTGSRTVTWSSSTGGFRFPSATTPLLSPGANKTDYIKFVYNGTDSKWDMLGMCPNL